MSGQELVLLSKEERAALEQLANYQQMLEAHRWRKPSDFYIPSPGQLSFHSSTAIMRALFPGNGWGKTTAAATEVDAWVTHTNRWQETPAWPVQIIWLCPKPEQFELLREQIETECFSKPFRRVEDYYEWPGGDRCWIVTSGTDWHSMGGINPDLVIYDEEIPLQLHREMQMRRRVRRKTRYVIAATATKGITWMYHQVFKPWLDYHMTKGLTEDQAMEQQLHPRIFCIAKGGIYDNPGHTQDDIDWYEGQAWSSEKERKVRLRGGFENWTAMPVFDEAGLDLLDAAAAALDAEMGQGRLNAWLEPLYKGDRRLRLRLILPSN